MGDLYVANIFLTNLFLVHTGENKEEKQMQKLSKVSGFQVGADWMGQLCLNRGGLERVMKMKGCFSEDNDQMLFIATGDVATGKWLRQQIRARIGKSVLKQKISK